MPANPRHYWFCLYPQPHRCVGNGWERLQYLVFCSHCSHLVPTPNSYVWEQLNPLLHKAFRLIGRYCSHCTHRFYRVLYVRAQGWGKVPYSVALCLLLAGVTRLLVPRLHRPIPVRSAGRPMPSPPSPAVLPCAVAASCPCLSADNPPQGTGAPHVWDLVLW